MCNCQPCIPILDTGCPDCLDNLSLKMIEGCGAHGYPCRTYETEHRICECALGHEVGCSEERDFDNARENDYFDDYD